MYRIEIIKDNEIAHYVIPTAWEEVTVAQYAKIFEIPSTSTRLDAAVWLFEQFTQIPKEDMMAMRMSEVNAIVTALDFLHTSTPTATANKIQAGGWTWRKMSAFNELTYGQMVSLNTIQSQHNDSWLRAMPELCCILLERVAENDEVLPWTTDAMTAAEDFKQCMITDVIGVFEDFHAGNVG